MFNIPRNPFMPPRSLNEFLTNHFDDNVCDHADDASVIITDLVNGSGYTVLHNRDVTNDDETGNLVITVQIKICVSDPDPTKIE